MPTQIPSFMQNTPSAPKKPFPSTPNDSVHPKRSFSRMLMFVIALLAIGGIAAYYFISISGDDTDNNENQAVVTLNNNQNSNSNTNTISNINTSLNANSASNTNSTSNTNTNTQNVNSLSNTNQSDSQTDTDGDGIPDNVEPFFGTDINKSDTDSDSYNDYDEIAGCYNPLGTGRIGREVFATHCNLFISDSTGNQSGVEALCNEWAPFSEKVINARVNGMTEEEAIAEVKNDSEYDILCQGNLDKGYAESDCQFMLFFAYEMCDISDWIFSDKVISD